ncbi:branched-chain amino acid ABC transporter permease [Paenirhodobacter populi]|uniref:Branched-chain amino acid ABC transporter permease n=1 Tax=Paenirhodobacter populi TaxID=2306993 RepID=A0A443JIU9_9RHOB|nr:branched-chain amino acid ABC transporter permease [Sinirhodobacter populi]RWR20444.1 branched-chain amino acid ABC transporter permease [Sinirhodobacter populi]
MTIPNKKLFALCLVVLALLFMAQFVLSNYLVLALTRILILAIFAMGYNMLMGYTGLLSLGHAMFFAAGLYAAGLANYYGGVSLPIAFVIGILGGGVLAFVIGLLALRTQTVSFMIVTLMFAQVAYLLTLYFSNVTGGDQGLTLPTASRSFSLFGLAVDLTSPMVRFNIALTLFAVVLIGLFAVTQGPLGRLFVAVRENINRTEMLGFDTYRIRLLAFTISGAISGLAGALYGLMFGFIGSSFAEFRSSIEVLLFTLVGGPGTLLGPLVGTGVMTMLIDRLSGMTSAYLIVVGVLLIVINLWFPKGILGTIRDRWVPWLK